jgi:glutamyl-tRNA synthetase/glutamyl-Q tRNA(Asp) synthetase
VLRPDVSTIQAAFGTPADGVITRFAPSPTGYLHLGHVVNAIYVWGLARAAGGRVLLRVEDHDRIRCRPEYEAALLEDLDWLGFVPDAGRVPLLRQSDDHAAYERALEALRTRHHVYACDCSRKDVGGETYRGRCRDRGLEAARGRGVRVRIEGGVERFDDLSLGPLEQEPAEQCGDLLLKDRDGHWTYQFAATVDDMRQGIALVVRGMDLVSSTGRQIRLARMLGREAPPRFLHHPLIIGASGEKLSKSNRDTGVQDLRRSGLSAAAVIGRAAHAVGLIDHARAIAADDVPELFT